MGDRKNVNELSGSARWANPWAERRVELPPYHTVYGALGPKWSEPPFTFSGVSMRVFPLRANLDAMQTFVNRTLNIIPQEAGYFRAFLPYAYLLVIDYGRMSIDAANLGWISQHEVAFSIPLEWYREERGKLVFKDWAYTSPYIFVDNELSMATGREVYGWPKALATLDPQVSSWTKDPTLPSRFATVSATLFSDPYKGKPVEKQVLLQVEQDRIQRIAKFPLESNNPLLPWVSIPKAIQGCSSLLGDYVDVLSGMGFIQRRPGVSVTSYLGMGRQLLSMLRGRDKTAEEAKLADQSRPSHIYFNTINLKQFRDTHRTHQACYQAVTNARMEVLRYNRGGLLGAESTLLGDVSGGFRILLHRHASLPIIENLGLQVKEDLCMGGQQVSTLEPVFPFWTDVDMNYNLGERVAWRVKKDRWHVGGEPPRPPQEEQPIQKDDGIPLCTLGGMSAQEIAGPFEFPNMTLRVLPLLAERKKLAQICKNYLNDPLESEGISFEPWGDYVYLVVSNHEEMTSDMSTVGSWAGCDVTCYLPVQEFGNLRGDGKEKELRGVALVPVFAYSDNDISANTSSEVNGIPKLKASIKHPPDTWLGNAGPSDSTERNLLELQTIVLPVLGQGQKAEERTLLKIRGGSDVLPNSIDDHRPWSFVAANWEERLLKEVQSRCEKAYGGFELKKQQKKNGLSAIKDVQNAFALALEILGNKAPVKVMTLKQFRDVSTPAQSCYQALVAVDYVFDKIFDIQEIEELIQVDIHHYPSQPITEVLGLIAKSVEQEGGTVVHKLEPIRPFWMRVSMKTELGRNLLWRADSAQWVRESQPTRYLDADGQGLIGSGKEVLDYLKSQQRLAHQVQQWYSSTKSSSMLRREDARKALLAVEPQMLIEMALSNQWESWDKAPRLHEQKPKKPDFCINKDRVKHLIERADLYRDWTNGATEMMSWNNLVEATWYVPPFERSFSAQPKIAAMKIAAMKIAAMEIIATHIPSEWERGSVNKDVLLNMTTDMLGSNQSLDEIVKNLKTLVGAGESTTATAQTGTEHSPQAASEAALAPKNGAPTTQQ